MRSLFLLSALALSLPAMSLAAEDAIYEVKSVSCASGELYPNGTIQIGSVYKESILRQIPKNDTATILTSGGDLVLSVVVSGQLGGACANENKSTVLTITFQRGQK